MQCTLGNVRRVYKKKWGGGSDSQLSEADFGGARAGLFDWYEYF